MFKMCMSSIYVPNSHPDNRNSGMAEVSITETKDGRPTIPAP